MGWWQWRRRRWCLITNSRTWPSTLCGVAIMAGYDGVRGTVHDDKSYFVVATLGRICGIKSQWPPWANCEGESKPLSGIENVEVLPTFPCRIRFHDLDMQLSPFHGKVDFRQILLSAKNMICGAQPFIRKFPFVAYIESSLSFCTTLREKGDRRQLVTQYRMQN